jgi:glycosyltransferase involved in cell wall biosynthesis
MAVVAMTELGAIARARLTQAVSSGGKVLPVRELSGETLPTVSVVVPCYNYGHYLPECTRSILEQPGVEVEILIVDDASPDGSGDVAEALAASEPRISVIRHPVNRGHIQTYNDGLAVAKGSYVVLLSADDLLTPGALGRAVALMEANPNVGLVYGNPRVFEDAAIPVAEERVHNWTVWSGADWIGAQCRRGMSCIYSPEAVVRTAVQRQVGGYDPGLPHSGDLDMWLRIAAVTGVGRVNGPDQAFRREHAASMMHTTFAAELDDLRERLAAYESFFAGAGAEVPGIERYRARARRGLAGEALGLASRALREGDLEGVARAYVDFAKSTYEDVDSLWQAQEYVVTRRSRTGTIDRIRCLFWAGRHDLEGRLRWQRWNRSGV